MQKKVVKMSKFWDDPPSQLWKFTTFFFRMNTSLKQILFTLGDLTYSYIKFNLCSLSIHLILPNNTLYLLWGEMQFVLNDLKAAVNWIENQYFTYKDYKLVKFREALKCIVEIKKNNNFSLQIYLYTVEVFFLSTYRRYKRNYLNVYTCMFTWLIYSTCHMSHVSTAKVNSDTAYKHTPVDNAWIIFINYYYHTWPFWARYSTCCVVYHKIWTKDHTGLG